MTKMVQLSDEAYRRLRAQKRKGESFSDVVLRFTAPKTPLDLTDLRTEAERQEATRWLAEADVLEEERLHRHDDDFTDLEARRRGRH